MPSLRCACSHHDWVRYGPSWARQRRRSVLLRTMSALRPMDSASEDDAAEAAKRKGEIDAADHRHCSELRPDDSKVCAAIENGLREGDEMRGRADDPHHLLQPDWHALHWRGAAGEKLHHKKDGSREQCELTHGRRDRAE